MWKVYALLAAVFAAGTAILAKIGVKDVDSNLATAIRTTVVLLLTWGIAFCSGALRNVKALDHISVLFLCLSGIATGLSWLFYFKALQCGDASKVAPVDKLSVAITIFLSILILHEPADFKVILGGILIVCGSIVIIL